MPAYDAFLPPVRAFSGNPDVVTGHEPSHSPEVDKASLRGVERLLPLTYENRVKTLDS
jgi:hypothetical protein